jgi:hypothetical protein
MVNTDRTPSSRRPQLTSLVGGDATSLAYRGFHWQLIGVAVLVADLPLQVAVDEWRLPLLELALVIAIAVLIVAQIRAYKLYMDGGRAASVFLSRQAGYQIKVKGGSIWLSGWRKQITKAAAARHQ